MANQNSEIRNPIFWCFIVLLTGIGLGVWGMIKQDCIGPNCWVGSGFLEWAAGIMIVAALIGFFTFSGRKS